MTEPLRDSARTAFSTWATDGRSTNDTVNSVPPAKSIPSRNPFRHIERMPGMMTISESAKNRFRRPMMFRRRGSLGLSSTVGSSFGASWRGGAPSDGPMSAACSCSVTSDSSDTVHPEQAGASEAAAREHDREQVVSHHDGRDQARKHTDRERDCKALDRGWTDEPEDEARDQRGRVRVTNRGPRAADRGVDRGCDRAPRPHLFFEPFEDQHVGVDRHADGQDEAGDAGQGQRDGDELEQGQDRARIEDEREARQQAGYAVVDDHEEDDYREPQQAGREAQLH